MTQDQLIKLMEELKKQLEQYMIRSAERQSKFDYWQMMKKILQFRVVSV